ncbi:MAG: nitroreductase family protein [Candidatus Marinimicrobia bacterium]|nr:nitroreductase family protein [Candidatus Neomarinimicrobiota bacterium]
MPYKKINFSKISTDEMNLRSKSLLHQIQQRRSVRDFSSQNVPIEVVKNCIKTAASAPSGANKQPWHFSLVQDKKIKKEIRIAAESEEKQFYEHRASKEWLEDLNQFGTDWKKPFLETAPFLIIIFSQVFEKNADGQNRKNYYVNESVGIAAGFLLAALHNAGLATLTHTPSPMNFLAKILKRPENERAYLLIPVGYPSKNAKVPIISKKPFSKIYTKI